MQAPTGSNSQGWAFVVIEDADKKKAIADFYGKNFDVYTNSPARQQFRDGRPASDAGRRGQIVGDVPARATSTVSRTWSSPSSEGRVDNVLGAVSAGFWGSILPAAWSLMLAARDARPRLGVDDVAPRRTRRTLPSFSASRTTSGARRACSRSRTRRAPTSSRRSASPSTSSSTGTPGEPNPAF